MAIFYRKDKFKLRKKYSVNLANEEIDTYFLNRPNVGLFVLLDHVRGEGWLAKGLGCHPPTLVVNSHLLFNGKRGDIKLLQVTLINRIIKKIVDSLEDPRVNVVWVGDFNLIPCSSLYVLLSRGSYDFFQEDIKLVSNQEVANIDLTEMSDKEAAYKLHLNTEYFKPDRSRFALKVSPIPLIPAVQ